jgi:hypothetical protein
MWPLATLSGWLVAGALYIRYQTARRKGEEIAQEALRVVQEAQDIAKDVYRVKLSCPVCDWVDLVVREDRVTAMEEGNRRIATHNEIEGHLLSGRPRSG